MSSKQLQLFPSTRRRRYCRTAPLVLAHVREKIADRTLGREVVVDGMVDPHERHGRTIAECPSLYKGRRVTISGRTTRSGQTFLTVEGLPLLLAPGEYH